MRNNNYSLIEKIRNLRKAKGLSQEELAIKLNVVRQTVSKWEKGLPVPDSSMLVLLAEELDTSVSVLLGETEQERSEVKIRTIRYLLILVCAIIVVVFIAFAAMNSEYLTWDCTHIQKTLIAENGNIWLITQEEQSPQIIELTDYKKINHMIILYWD